MGIHTKKILHHLCEMVGATNVDFKSPDWYTTHTWTKQQEKEFINWMVKYLTKNAEARQEIMARPSKNKKMIKELVLEFTYQYGWDYTRGTKMEYYYLRKGNIIKKGDEVDICNDGWRDDPKWVKAKRVGEQAPDPQYVSHRQYRRKIKKAV